MVRALRGYSTPRPRDFNPDEFVNLTSALGGARVRIKRVYDRVTDLWEVALADTGLAFVISGRMLERRVPIWRAGDVIVVQHHGYGPKYTYVRGSDRWLTEHGGHGDDTVNAWYRAGWVTPTLQDGGQPFDLSRL